MSGLGGPIERPTKRPRQQSIVKALALVAIVWKVLDVISLGISSSSVQQHVSDGQITTAEQMITTLSVSGSGCKEESIEAASSIINSTERANHVKTTAKITAHESHQRDLSLYLPTVPHPDEWPWPLDNPSWSTSTSIAHNKSNHDSDDTVITITTCIPVMTRQVDVETNLPRVLASIQNQTVKADEVAIVISDVDRLRMKWKQKGAEDGWCQATLNFVRHFLPVADVPSVRVVCVGGRLTAGWARNVLARAATGTILSFIDADDEEYPVRNEVIQNMFSCYRGQLNLLLHGYAKDGVMHRYETRMGYKEEEKGRPRYAVRPGDRCADDELAKPRLGPPLVAYGNKLYEKLWETFDRWVLGGRNGVIEGMGIAHGHMIIHRRVFQHVHFTTLAKGEDAMFARDIVMTYGSRKEAAICLGRPLTWYRKAGNANEDLITSEAA